MQLPSHPLWRTSPWYGFTNERSLSSLTPRHFFAWRGVGSTSLCSARCGLISPGICHEKWGSELLRRNRGTWREKVLRFFINRVESLSSGLWHGYNFILSDRRVSMELADPPIADALEEQSLHLEVYYRWCVLSWANISLSPLFTFSEAIKVGTYNA